MADPFGYVANQKRGDGSYFDGVAWVHLPIGTSGQFLWVASGLPAWRTLAAGDLPAHGASEHTNRTRRIPLVPIWNRRTAAFPAFVFDAHGTLMTDNAHLDEADGNATYKQIVFAPVIMPADYVAGTVTIYVAYSSSVGGNNVVFQKLVREYATGSATAVNSDANAQTQAVHANADTISFGAGMNLSFNPTAGNTLHVELGFARDHASDSNTGTLSAWAYWLEYTGDG